jgi:hypothetical protein
MNETSSSPPPPKKVNANPKKDFNEMVSVYIDNINDGESVRDKSETVSELEIRFGTNPVWRNR